MLRRGLLLLVVSLAPAAARATEIYVSTEDGGEVVVIDAERSEVAARILLDDGRTLDGTVFTTESVPGGRPASASRH